MQAISWPSYVEKKLHMALSWGLLLWEASTLENGSTPKKTSYIISCTPAEITCKICVQLLSVHLSHYFRAILCGLVIKSWMRLIYVLCKKSNDHDCMNLSLKINWAEVRIILLYKEHGTDCMWLWMMTSITYICTDGWSVNTKLWETSIMCDRKETEIRG